jgi:putative ABC transport system permease protein
MILFIKLIKESAVFAAVSIVANKLRTLLTLSGITIGIFSIISVFSVVDSLERQIRTSIESLGDNVVYIAKWPWQFGGEYQWWRYVNRPSPKLSET